MTAESSHANQRRRGALGQMIEKRRGVAWLAGALDMTIVRGPKREGRHRLPDGPVQSRLQRYPGGAKLVGFHKGLVEAVSRVPFPQAVGTQIMVRACRDAPTAKARLGAMAALIGYVGALSKGHMENAAFRGSNALYHSQLFLNHPSLWTGLAATLEGVTAAGYTAVTYTQASIAASTVVKTSKELLRPGSLSEPPKDRDPIRTAGVFPAIIGITAARAGTDMAANMADIEDPAIFGLD